MVLDRPEIPLHTNGSVNDIRCQDTRRKVSAGTRSDMGRDYGDAFLSLAKTCGKNGIAVWDYLGSRLRVGERDKLLPTLIHLHGIRVSEAVDFAGPTSAERPWSRNGLTLGTAVAACIACAENNLSNDQPPALPPSSRRAKNLADGDRGRARSATATPISELCLTTPVWLTRL
jgi:hypothetical protein